jgi:phosphoenolpyruvate---glycerone phosphotransferase subunit DhaL
MERASIEDVRRALQGACEAIVAAQDRLTRADQVIGDGDHGAGMARGFRAAREALDAAAPASVGDLFKAVGTAVLAKSGGASGAVFGTFFIGAARPLDRTDLTAAALLEALTAGTQAVRDRGKAQPGDKTMVDAALPAIEAASAATGDELRAVAAAAADGARRGAEATRAMIARFGKAKTLGERAVGHIDPGALSLSIILEALAASLATRDSV